MSNKSGALVIVVDPDLDIGYTCKYDTEDKYPKWLIQDCDGKKFHMHGTREGLENAGFIVIEQVE